MPTFRATSLVYALMISLLITLIIGGLVLLMHYQRMLQEQLYARELARDNLISATNLYLNGNPVQYGQRRGILFDSPTDSFYVESESWGVFGLLHVRATHGTTQASKSCLYGSDPAGITKAALYLQDQNKPLKLVGKSRLIGSAYLPRGGVSGGRVGRRGFMGKRLINGQVLESRDTPPNISYEALAPIAKEMGLLMQGQIPLAPESRLTEDSLRGNWQEPPLYFPSPGTQHLDRILLRDKVMVIATEAIHVGSSAELDQVILIAPKIVIEAGFTGRLQAFAMDSLLVERAVRLRYPSALVVSGRNPAFPGYLSIEERCQIEGVVINDPQLAGQMYTRDQVTDIAETAQVYGHVLSPGTVLHAGEIYGFLMAGKFILNTGSTVFVNHIRDATISQPELSSRFAGGLYIRGGEAFSVVEWLEE